MCPRPLRVHLQGAGVDVTLGPGTYILGRAAEAAVPIESPAVSRYHARLVIDDETATIEDLGSKNGTFVGDNPVAKPTQLSQGDRLRFGQFAAQLRVVFEVSASHV